MSKTIDEYKKEYATALANKDAAGMKNANDGANAIRSQTGTALEDASGHYNKIAASNPTPTPAPGSQESHQARINNAQSGQGGMDVYTANQQSKYDKALASGDQNTINALLADMDRVGYSINQQAPVQPVQPTTLPQQNTGYSEPQRPSFDSQAAMDKILAMLKDSSDASFDAQKSQLDATLSNQLAQLEQSFLEAVQAGEMSVNEAKEQFESQKKQLEQAAYQQSQQTKAYGNEMGIAQSQQMVGLQQGDNARVNDMNNSNLSDRDKRLNDIKDRINMITQQKGLEASRATAEHGYGVAGARAQSDAGYMNSIAGLMGQDYMAKQGFDHDFAMQDRQFSQADKTLDKTMGHDKDMQGDRFQQEEKMFDLSSKHSEKILGKQLDNDLLKMATANGYDLTKMDKDQLHKLEYLGESNKLTVQNMGIQQGYTVENIMMNFNNAMKQQQSQNSFTAGENSKSRAAASANLTDKIADEEARYQLMLDRDLNQYDPNTKEGQAAIKAAEQAKNSKVAEMVEGALFTENMTEVFNDPMLKWDKEKPTDFTKVNDGNLFKGLDWMFGGINNIVYGTKKKTETWEANQKAQQDAVQKKLDFINNPLGK